MNTKVIAVLLVALVAGVAIASVVNIPAGGGAFCRGRYLGPGIQLKVPFSKVSRYETNEQTVAVAKSLESRDGDRQDFSLQAVFRWDFQRLPNEPFDPSLVQSRLLSRLAELDGTYPTASLGTRTEGELRETLAALPIVVERIEADYPLPQFAELKAAARPTGHKLVIVGVDGFDWGLLDRLIDDGRCPTFAQMKKSGAWGEIVSRPPVLSPLIWTTMGTGRMPEVHGILDFVVTDAATGKDVPITNQSREVHAFWNILSAIDLKVNVVNWWATYPA